MCNGCAFRPGTYANGCEQTIKNAAVCVVTGTPFHCHIKREPDGEESVCAGFMSALRDRNRRRHQRRAK